MNESEVITVEDVIKSAYQHGKRDGIKQGREDAIADSIKIISEMRNSAESNMLWEYAKACDLITVQLKQLKEKKNG